MQRNHIKIAYNDPITPEMAMERVAEVIKNGLVSANHHGVSHYCWASRFSDGTTVYVRDRKSDRGTHSFLVVAPTEQEANGEANGTT